MCGQCWKPLPLTAFNRDVTRTGYQSYCRLCKVHNRRFWQAVRGSAHYANERTYDNHAAARSAARRHYGSATLRQCAGHGCDKRAEHWHHFNGYNIAHWLDVEPLCHRCHGQRHGSDYATGQRQWTQLAWSMGIDTPRYNNYGFI